jgi:hypothetical protein
MTFIIIHASKMNPSTPIYKGATGGLMRKKREYMGNAYGARHQICPVPFSYVPLLMGLAISLAGL